MRCPECRYVMEQHGELGSEDVEYVCTNPWHPRRPGACPHCDSTADHRAAGIGDLDAKCVECDHIWTPFPKG